MQGRIIGIALLVGGAIGVALFGVSLLLWVLMVIFPGTQSTRELFESGAVLTGLSSPFGIAGAAMMFIGSRSLRRARRLETIRANVMSHGRVEVGGLSTQIGLNVTRTRKLLQDAISRGLVRGEFASENVFVSAMDPSDIHMVTAPCVGCGATTQSLVREGEALVCPFCGTVAATGYAAPGGGNAHQVEAVKLAETSASHSTPDRYARNRTDSVTYTRTRKSSTTSLVFVGVGVLFAVSGFLLTILLLFVAPPVALITFGGSVFGLAFGAYGGWRWYSNSRRRLQLNAQELVSLTNGKSFQLRLADIRAVWVREGAYWTTNPLSDIDVRTQRRYWFVRIEAIAGNYLDLDVTQDGYIGLFDVAQVLRDLLPRLPSTAQIDPRIRNYLATGRIT